MRDYNERQHAFISATFYRRLSAEYGERGVQTFTLATQRYAEQRGSRMAQKAIMLGLPLNFESYLALGEWEFTQGFLADLDSPQAEVVSFEPDFEFNFLACPWHEQYKAMGLMEGARVYCKDLDTSIARGFNPYLTFEVPQTMHDGEKCMFRLKGAALTGPVEKKREYLLPFEYHCAHLYFTFSAICKSIFKSEGVALSAQVLSDFGAEYGKDMADGLTRYEGEDFNVIRIWQ